MSGLSRLVCAVVALYLAPMGIVQAAGDHGAAKTVSVSPRVEARVGTRQFVLVYANRRMFEDRQFQFFGNVQRPKFDRPRLALFIEDFATAEPVSGAEVEATVNFLPESMSEIAPGVYVTGEIVLGGGRNEVEIAFAMDGESGTVPMLLMIAGGESTGTASSAAAVSTVRPVAIPDWLFVAAGLAVYAAAAGVFMMRRSRRAGARAGTRSH